MDLLQYTQLHPNFPFSQYFRLPEKAVQDYSSSRIAPVPDHQWVIGRFSTSADNICFFGGNGGAIGVVDVSKVHSASTNEDTNAFATVFDGHQGVVIDISERPNYNTQFFSISGDTTVRLWDFSRRNMLREYSRHERTVRSIAVNKMNPNMFVTSSRDGMIIRWDARVKNPVFLIPKAHEDLKSSKKSTPVRSLRSRNPRDPTSVTSVVFINDHCFASASENSATGIKIWDIRSMRYEPLSVFHLPIHNRGISCLTPDRFCNSLFAAVTDNKIYEYSLSTSAQSPIRTYSGGHNTFFSQVAASPISDHIMFGGREGNAFIWDIQDQYGCPDLAQYQPVFYEKNEIKPRFRLSGLNETVCGVGWSCSAKYLLTMDDYSIRFWDYSRPFVSSHHNDNSDCPGFVRVNVLENRNQPVSFVIAPAAQEQCLLSPVKRAGLTATRRTTIRSPLKSNFSNISPSTPRAKRRRLDTNSSHDDNSLTPPKKSQNSSPAKTPTKSPSRRLSISARFPTPTWNLPNFRYAQYLKKLKEHELGVAASESAVKTISPIRNLDDWLRRPTTKRLIRMPTVADFEGSSCSKMLTEEERVKANSPQKIVIRTPQK